MLSHKAVARRCGINSSNITELVLEARIIHTVATIEVLFIDFALEKR